MSDPGSRQAAPATASWPAGPWVQLFGRRLQAYRTWGLTGLALALAAASTLAFARGMSVAVLGGMLVAGVATFLLLVVVTRWISGQELIINYHHEIGVVAVNALLLRLLGQPVLPYLDLLVIGLGLFVACGRLGCLTVGCCHGRVASWGVRYGAAHAAEGFPAFLVGVPLLPVQLFESLWVFTLVAGDVGLVLAGAAPGTALAWHAAGYACGRFTCELFRGDPGRRYGGPFSEAQWTSLAVLSLVNGLALAGALPGVGVLWLAWAGLASMMLALRLAGRHHPLLAPRHVHELASLLAEARARAQVEGGVVVGETSAGLRLSASRLPPPPDGAAPREGEVLGLSCSRHLLPPRLIRRLGRVLVRLTGTPGGELVAGRGGVFHLVIEGPEVAHGI